MKKTFSAILVIAMLCAISIPCFAAENGAYWDIIETSTDNTIVAKNTTGISGGIAYVQLYCLTNDSLAVRITATSYIEKLVGSQWVIMTLESGDTQWTNTISGNSMNMFVEQKITSGTGQYKVTTVFEIYRAGSSSQTATATYTTTY